MHLLILLLFSIVVTFASPQAPVVPVDVSVTPDTEIILSNSANTVKFIKKDSGNLYRKTYFIKNELTPSPNSHHLKDGRRKTTTDIDLPLGEIGQVTQQIVN